MTLFFVSFFLLYGFLHFYVLYKARLAFSLNITTCLVLFLFFIAMMVVPLAARHLERAGLDHIARPVAYAGYLWMGFIFLAFTFVFLAELARSAINFFSVIWGKTPWSTAAAAGKFFLAGVACAFAVVCYGSYEAANVRTERITIPSRKVPPSVGTFRIAQISDVHVGLIIGEERLRKINAIIRKENPDVLVSTGDLIDGQKNNTAKLVKLFQGIKPRFGKFAVTGNHEYYAGLADALEITGASGFRVLRGESEVVAGFLRITGVDDAAGISFGDHRLADKTRTLSTEEGDGLFTILLKHRPDVDLSGGGDFDLQLSGHTHQGQIFPFALVVRFFFKYYGGYYALPGGRSIYVNRGSGTWGPPIRVLSPPEVTIIDLVHEPA